MSGNIVESVIIFAVTTAVAPIAKVVYGLVTKSFMAPVISSAASVLALGRNERFCAYFLCERRRGQALFLYNRRVIATNLWEDTHAEDRDQVRSTPTSCRALTVSPTEKIAREPAVSCCSPAIRRSST